MTSTSGLLAMSPLGVTISRVRTHDARSDLVHAALDATGPPEWERSFSVERAYAATLAEVERLGRDPDVLIEALLWHDDLREWCWSEVHERCCNEGFEHAHAAWWEGVQAIANMHNRRPAWIGGHTWFKLRRIAMQAAAAGGMDWAYALDVIEHDDDLYYDAQDEGVDRHMQTCTRGSVGGDFHSVP